jgi:4-amino-4-deoxy-L-arabinose transferase-like glycosyltransferase
MALLEQLEQAGPDRQHLTGQVALPGDAVQAPRHSRLGGLRTRIVLALIAIACVKQIVLAVAYPPFEGHDEVAHLGYVATLADDGRLPTFSDDLPASLEAYSRFTLDWPAIYTANHPPLYYVFSIPAYKLAGDDHLAQLYAVRLVSIPFFLLTVWLAYLIARMLFPAGNLIVLGAPAIVAFQPQLGFEGAIVNNDMLAIMFGTLLLYLCLRAIRDGLSIRLALVLGLTCGLGLLTKATLLALLPIVAAVCVWLQWPRPWARVRSRDWWQSTLARALVIIGPAVALALPWYLYLRRTYGDFTAFEATQELQRNWNHPAGTLTELLFSGSFHKERIHETWGYYGWRLIPLDAGELAVVYVMMSLAGLGALLGLLRWLQQLRENGWPGRTTFAGRQATGIATLAAASVLMYGAMVYFGTMFLLTQARYFFPVLPAAIVLAAAGLRVLVPEDWQRPATIVLVGGAVGFQFLILTKLVLPYAYL